MNKMKSYDFAKYSDVFERTVKFIEKEQLLRTDLWIRFVQQFKEDADYEGGWLWQSVSCSGNLP